MASDVTQLVAMADAKLAWGTRGDAKQFGPLLEPGERVLTMANGIVGGVRGILGVTDRRVMFFGSRSLTDYPLSMIGAVSTKKALMTSTLTMTFQGQLIEVTGLLPKPADEVAAHIRTARSNGTAAGTSPGISAPGAASQPALAPPQVPPALMPQACAHCQTVLPAGATSCEQCGALVKLLVPGAAAASGNQLVRALPPPHERVAKVARNLRLWERAAFGSQLKELATQLEGDEDVRDLAAGTLSVVCVTDRRVLEVDRSFSGSMAIRQVRYSDTLDVRVEGGLFAAAIVARIHAGGQLRFKVRSTGRATRLVHFMAGQAPAGRADHAPALTVPERIARSWRNASRNTKLGIVGAFVVVLAIGALGPSTDNASPGEAAAVEPPVAVPAVSRDATTPAPPAQAADGGGKTATDECDAYFASVGRFVTCDQASQSSRDRAKQFVDTVKSTKGVSGDPAACKQGLAALTLDAEAFGCDLDALPQRDVAPTGTTATDDAEARAEQERRRVDEARIAEKEAAREEAARERAEKARLKARVFLKDSNPDRYADKIATLFMNSANADMVWETKHQGKYVRWKANYEREGVIVEFVASAGEVTAISCKNFDPAHDAGAFNPGRWDQIIVEGRLEAFQQQLGKEKLEFVLTECIAKTR